MQTRLHVSSAFLLICLIAFSCKKEKNSEENNENELITTVTLEFTEEGSGAKQFFAWQDADGPGGNPPVADAIVLDKNKTYDVKLSFLDETKDPVEDVTTEIGEESDVHRIYFQPSESTGLTVSGLDTDGNGLPLGLNSVWQTTAEGTGTISLVLRHYANGGKEASDPVNSTKSSTDAEVEFTVTVNAD